MSFRISRCCAAICCGIALLSFAATDSNTISGIVRDESGKPVATVTIVLTGSQAGSPVIKTQSGETGEYRFTGLAPGDYTITAEFSGYAMQAQPIHLPSPTQVVVADLILRRTSSTTDSGTPAKPSLQLQASGIHGLIDPGGYSASVSADAASGLLRGMADVKRADATSGLTSTKDWPCDMEPTLQKAVEASPHKGQANRELGQFYLAHDQPAKAIPLLQRAVQLDNKDYAASKALGIAWLRNGQFEEAHKQFSALVDVGGEASAQAQGQAHERAEIYQLLAHSDEGLGMFKEAAEDYRKASLEEPSEQSVFGIGYELVLAGSAADALVVFQDGKQKYAQSVSLRIGIGTAQFLLGHASDALRNFLEASDLDPSDARPYPLVAAASGVASDQSERVLATLKRFLDLNPGNPLANYLYALILSRDGTHADTRRIEGLLKNAIHLDPRLAKAHLQLADLYAERGDYQEAIPEYETAARVAPDLSETHYRLAIAYKRMGRSGQSAREMQIFQQQKTKQSTATGNDGIDLAQFISVMDAPSESSVPQTTCAAPVQSRP